MPRKRNKTATDLGAMERVRSTIARNRAKPTDVVLQGPPTTPGVYRITLAGGVSRTLKIEWTRAGLAWTDPHGLERGNNESRYPVSRLGHIVECEEVTL